MTRKKLYAANFLFLLFDMCTSLFKWSIENQDFILARGESKHSKPELIEVSVTEFSYFPLLPLKNKHSDFLQIITLLSVSPL